MARYSVFGTLTYPDGPEWHDCKRHWRAFIEALRRRHPRAAESVFWFLEFQRNGRPHLHFFATGFVDKDWLATTWARIVDAEDFSRHKSAGTRIERFKFGRAAAVSYARKYASKQDQKELPPVLVDSGFGRWWGVAGDRKCRTAGARISPGHFRSAGIQRSWKHVFDQLEGLVSAGRATRLDASAGTCFWLRDDAADELLRSAIEALKRGLDPPELHRSGAPDRARWIL